MNSLVVNIGTEEIPVSLFAADIQDIIDSGMGDVQELFQNFRPDATGAAGELRVNPKVLKGVEYRFNVSPDSTAKKNQQEELASLERLIGTIGKFQNIFKDDPRVDVNWGAMMDAYEKASGVKGANNFVTFNPEAPAPHDVQAQLANKPPPPKQILSYKDAPEDIKRQMEQADGYQPSQNPQTPEMVLKAHAQDAKIETDSAKIMLDAHKHTIDSGQQALQHAMQMKQQSEATQTQAQTAKETAQARQKPTPKVK
jgi:hypothetical protein